MGTTTRYLTKSRFKVVTECACKAGEAFPNLYSINVKRGQDGKPRIQP